MLRQYTGNSWSVMMEVSYSNVVVRLSVSRATEAEGSEDFRIPLGFPFDRIFLGPTKVCTATRTWRVQRLRDISYNSQHLVHLMWRKVEQFQPSLMTSSRPTHSCTISRASSPAKSIHSQIYIWVSHENILIQERRLQGGRGDTSPQHFG